MELLDFEYLEWSQWFPMSEGKLPRLITNESGIYRVRRAGQSHSDYIGQTNSLRRRLLSLRVSLKDQEMPWNDPHVASARFWALSEQEEVELEASVASSPNNPIIRKSFESLTIAHHRRDFGCSPTFNFGRMPDGWIASSSRSKGERGYYDSQIKYSKHQSSMFSTDSELRSKDWLGMEWEVFDNINIEEAGGVYRGLDPETELPIYIGESSRITNRIRSHQKKIEASWQWVAMPGLDHSQRLEIENDLIASVICSTGQPPLMQFQNR